MSAILMPELVIYNALTSIINLLRKNLSDNAGHDDLTILYGLLGKDVDGNPLKINSFNYFAQAKKILSRPDSLSVNFGYNLAVAKIISLHILLPSEAYESSSIGQLAGGDDEEMMQFYNCNYQVMITSDNSNEVNVVYNILKSMLIMLVPHLELMGLITPKLSGGDVIMQDEFIPATISHKVLNISFRYELNIPTLLEKTVMSGFYAELKAIDYFGESN